jgi:hypothetical protein
MIFAGYEDGSPLNLENSTCDRQIWPDGSLFEIVMLDGPIEELTEEELEAFIARYPIRRNTPA